MSIFSTHNLTYCSFPSQIPETKQESPWPHHCPASVPCWAMAATICRCLVFTPLTACSDSLLPLTKTAASRGRAEQPSCTYYIFIINSKLKWVTVHFGHVNYRAEMAFNTQPSTPCLYHVQAGYTADSRQFDIVCANILRGPLLELQPRLMEYCKCVRAHIGEGLVMCTGTIAGTSCTAKAHVDASMSHACMCANAVK